jgi:hypothetical protein
MVQPIQGELLLQLGKIVASHENEFAAKALCRLLALQKDLLAETIPELVGMLTSRIQHLCQTPAKPDFNHNIFECLALSIRILCQKEPSAVQSFESSLMPIFFQVLEKDVGEIVPYVFQVKYFHTFIEILLKVSLASFFYLEFLKFVYFRFFSNLNFFKNFDAKDTASNVSYLNLKKNMMK